MTPADPKATRGIRIRLFLCGAFFLLLLAVAMARAVQLQVLQGDRLAGMARDQYLRELALTPRRGPIVDARGVPLAESVEADSIFVDPSALEPGVPVDKLARALKLERALVQKRVSGKGSFAWLKRRVTPAESEAVRALKLRGVGTVREFRRFYPQRNLAAHVTGLVGIDNDGLDGVEKAFDAALRGNLLEVRAIRDVKGAHLLQEPGVPSAALSGATVQLTIDSAIQHAAEEALARGVAKANAAAGMVVVMDPHTGAVLALANHPTYNPNAPGAPGEARRNRAIIDTYEPGSTMKVFLMAAALSDRLVRPETVIDLQNGALPMGRKTIRDSHKPEKNDATVTEILATSSNVGCAKIGLRMGASRLVGWMREFGFGDRTGIGFSGEPRGQLQDPARMGEVAVATTSFGQGMTATPLQLAAAASALANGGKLLRPYVVQKVVQADGTLLVDRRPEVVREPVTPEIARTVTRMMTAVTKKGGTGTLAAVQGFEVAGKTGTAQKADPITKGYSADRRFSSFVGFLPADAPKVAVFVGLDEPRGDVYGGLIAAPIFREVAAEALRQLGVLPASGAAALEAAALASEAGRREAASDAAAGRGRPQDVVPADDEFLAEAPVAGDGDRAPVPELSGLSARAALRLLHERGLEAELVGSGRAVKQEPAAGRSVARGARVRVVLEAG